MKKAVVPDAWDDDWESQADRTAVEEDDAGEQGGASLQPAEAAPPLTKAERITKHEEANRMMWESADSTPQTFHYVEANNTVPLTTSFKPQVKVLSRKPVIARRDPVTGGMSQLSMDDDDSEITKERQLTAEEVRAKQKRDLEERQRRYDEARAKIFGESNPSSRGSSPGTVTPPRSDSRHAGRGRGRGGGQRNNTNNSTSTNNNDVRAQSEMRRPNNQPMSMRELYDPNFSPKPDSMVQRRGGGAGESDGSGRGTPMRDDQFQNQYQSPPPPPPQQQQQQAIRSPRGPDGSGRGGFGFARRGNKES
ncbi:hypothetical protein QQS21_001505 [Conoideocrella luteorostrata]|uniref:SUZ domain-containing protein n=1 Tax=Conoideocrella luteorostrata TaxID=1105319 RepID=A0AAJ0FY46_9HYPO|nr:hypothetical protein QQS21_001505 [Conoideocrella luteorostrata]